MTFDLLVVSKLLSGRRVPFALTLNATIVRTCIRPTERLILHGLLIFLARHICCVLIEIILVEKLMIRSFLNGLLFFIALPRSLINLPTGQLARGTTAKVLLDPANDLTIVVGCGTAGGVCTATRWWFVSSLHLLEGGRVLLALILLASCSWSYLSTALHLVEISSLLITDTGASNASWRRAAAT